jgi:hypothetical protein
MVEGQRCLSNTLSEYFSTCAYLIKSVGACGEATPDSAYLGMSWRSSHARPRTEEQGRRQSLEQRHSLIQQYMQMDVTETWQYNRSCHCRAASCQKGP